MARRCLVLHKRPYLGFGEYFHSLGWEVLGWTTQTNSGGRHPVCLELFDFDGAVRRALQNPPPRDLAGRARRLEDQYGFSVADVIGADRHMGAPWMTGGCYHRGQLATLPYAKHLQVICEAHDALRAFLERARPDLVCTGQFGNFYSALLFFACHSLGVPIYSLNGLSYANYFYWSPDRFGTVPGLEAEYRALEQEPCLTGRAEISDIAPYMRQLIPGMRARGSPSALLRSLWIAGSTAIRSRLGGHASAANVGLRAKVRYHWLTWSNFRREMRRPYPTLDELGARPFVFFPLQTEPESALNGLEPYLTNQMFAIEMLSKSVPADYLVLVKEHPGAVGERPRGWMDTVSGFPRVGLAHPFQSSIELIRLARATVTICGTAGLEAAILGQPVISLGRRYRFNFIDHVFFAETIPDLRRLLLEIDRSPASAAYQADGARLKAAIERTCIPLDENPWAEAPSPGAIARLAEGLRKLVG